MKLVKNDGKDSSVTKIQAPCMFFIFKIVRNHKFWVQPWKEHAAPSIGNKYKFEKNDGAIMQIQEMET